MVPLLHCQLHCELKAAKPEENHIRNWTPNNFTNAYFCHLNTNTQIEIQIQIKIAFEIGPRIISKMHSNTFCHPLHRHVWRHDGRLGTSNCFVKLWNADRFKQDPLLIYKFAKYHFSSKYENFPTKRLLIKALSTSPVGVAGKSNKNDKINKVNSFAMMVDLMTRQTLSNIEVFLGLLAICEKIGWHNFFWRKKAALEKGDVNFPLLVVGG